MPRGPRSCSKRRSRSGVAENDVRQDLDRDVSAEARVLRPVDLTHPARPDLAEDLVGTELRAGGERHRVSGVRTAGSSSRKRSKAPTSQVTRVATRAFRAHDAIRAS